MSAVIQNEYTGNGSTTTYSFTFPYLKTSDIKASLDGVETTAFTLPNATTLQFNTAPTNQAKIKIFRQTGVDNLTATFYAGSAIKSEDLNDNFTQNLYKTQEVGGRFISNLGGTMTGDLNMGEDTVIKFEGATDDAHETTLTVADPTADRTITLPNVTGTVVTTGDTGTVDTAMIAADAIDGTKIAHNVVNSEHYIYGSIDRVHLSADVVDGTKIADDSINSEHYVADSIDTEHYAAGSVDATALGTNAVTRVKIIADAVDGTKIADNSIDSEHYVDGSIDNAHLANNSVTQAKMADDSVGTAELVDGSVDTARLADNSVTLAKMTDNSVGTSEIVDDAVTTAKLASNAVTTAKITDANVTTAKLAADAVTNDKLADNSVSTENIQDGDISTAKIASSAVTTAKIASDAVTTVKIPNDAVTTAKIADSELKTLAGMQSGTASKLADSTALTADIADLNQIDGLTKQTTISDSDASFPTSGAVVDYVAAQIAPLGGLEVIATEVAFPNTQPQAGVVISISDAGGVVFNGSGTSTTGRTVGGSTVTINNAPSSLNSETLVAGVGLMVSSTGSGQVYNYHKILGKEDDIKQLSDDINDFNARYRVGSSNPTSALDAGDLFFNTSTSKLLVYNATNTAWEEAQSIGNFFISTLSPAFDNSTQNFTITNAPTNAEQIILSINGVIQKPNAGTSTPSEGFALDGSTVKLAAAPPTGSTYFAVVVGSTVNIGQPSNNTVSTAVLQNSSVTTAKIADDAVTAAKIGTLTADVDFNDNAKARFGTGNDLKLYHNGSHSYLDNATGSLFLRGDAIKLRNAAGSEAYIECFANGAVKLSYDDSIKLQTESWGVDITGTLRADTLKLSDDHKLQLGTSNDLEIYHDGNHSRISDEGSGSLLIQSNGANIQLNKGTTENMLIANVDGAVELYYDNSKKFETTSYGNASAGQVRVTSSNASTVAFSCGDVGTGLYNAGTNIIGYSVNGTEKLRIDSSGNLILGATSYQNGGFGGSSSGINIAGTQPQILLHETDTDKDGYFGLAGSILRIQTADSIPVTIWTNDTKRINVHETTGDTTLETGNLVIGTAGKGINFSAYATSGNPSSNLLDDYEEGTWTPTTENSGGGFSNMVSATYTKIGRLVNVSAYAVFNSSQPNSNQVKIGGLPFQSTGTIYHYAVGRLQGFAANDIVWQVGGTGDHFTPYYNNVIPTYNQVGGYYFLISGSYITNS